MSACGGLGWAHRTVRDTAANLGRGHEITRAPDRALGPALPSWGGATCAASGRFSWRPGVGVLCTVRPCREGMNAHCIAVSS